jgi:myo-inositol-1(or 4)-monophosphatase
VADLPVAADGRTAAGVARDAAAAASAIVLPRFHRLTRGDPVEKVAKSRGNYVTETDLACEEAAFGVIRSAFPDARILSEETADVAEDWDSGWLWVIDPIDGTGNFARGIPTFVFNIALCHDGEPLLGLTHQPVTGDEFLATRGGGLSVNGERTQISPVEILEDALTGFGLGYRYDRAKMLLELLGDLWPGIQMVQNIGSAALGLAYASSGRFDLYVHSFLYPWDLAAGICQVRESGGLALARDGSEATIYSEGIIAGAPGPAQQFLDLTRERAWR